MRINDIYAEKSGYNVIQVIGFTNSVVKNSKSEPYVVCNQMRSSKGTIWSDAADMVHGTEHEIAEKYELVVPCEIISDFHSWNEIFRVVYNRKLKVGKK